MRADPRLRQRARWLRRHPTEAERLLWLRLCAHQLGGVPFRRQAVIGPYILDFYCPSARLVIEIDGPVHRGDSAHRDLDRRRREYLERMGLTLLVFSNQEVLERLEEVLFRIGAHLIAPR